MALSAPFSICLLAFCLMQQAPVSSGSISTGASNKTGLVMTLQPDEIIHDITERVTLRCEDVDSSKDKIREPMELRIIRQVSGHWKKMAVIKQNTQEITVYDTAAEVTGKITDGIEDSYIQIVWPVANKDTFGTVRCELIGDDVDIHVMTESTADLEIKEKKLSIPGLLDIFLNQRKKTAKKVSNLTLSLNELKSQSQRQTISNWPEGSYSLLKPEAGCPDDSAFHHQQVAYMGIPTQSSTTGGLIPNNNAYPHAHLSQPIISNIGKDNLFYLRFCPSDNAQSSISWPQGEYCINKGAGECPSGFLNRYYRLYEQSLYPYRDVFSGPGIRSKYIENCCRNDSSRKSEINLPTAWPFYLYSFEYECQLVRDMKATKEHITIDTKWDRKLPNGTLHKENVLYLPVCYYEKVLSDVD